MDQGARDDRAGLIAAVAQTRGKPRQRARRRRNRPRSRTLNTRRQRTDALKVRALLAPSFHAGDAELFAGRPTHRDQCRGEARPCPWVGCKHHLFLSVNPENGSIQFTFPELEPWELQQTCALDVAEHGGATLERVGELINVTRERTRQIEIKGLHKLRRNGAPHPDDGDRPVDGC